MYMGLEKRAIISFLLLFYLYSVIPPTSDNTCKDTSPIVRKSVFVIFTQVRQKLATIAILEKQRFYHRVMHPKDADSIANSEDPDQTAPLGSGSALFAQTNLSENLGSLRYIQVPSLFLASIAGRASLPDLVGNPDRFAHRAQ